MNEGIDYLLACEALHLRTLEYALAVVLLGIDELWLEYFHTSLALDDSSYRLAYFSTPWHDGGWSYNPSDIQDCKKSMQKSFLGTFLAVKPDHLILNAVTYNLVGARVSSMAFVLS